MLSYSDALACILSSCRPLPSRRVPLAAAAGLVSARTTLARTDVPPFDNAAMDGYALRAADTGLPQLRVRGSLPAGTAPTAAPDPGEAWEIMTGAPLPPGCDSVVPLERTERIESSDGTWIRVVQPCAPGANVRRAGEDFKAGAAVIHAGRRLDAAAIMALAATGEDSVEVRSRPRVAVLTTGAELSTTGVPAGAAIRDANGPYLHALLPAAGAEPVMAATTGDDPALLRETIARLAATADVVITTGGVSAGRLDYVPAVLRELGAEILFHKVAIRPGKPILYAQLPAGPLVFGLPGNPIAVAVGFRFFVVPALRVLSGLPPEKFPEVPCTNPEGPPRQFRFFAKARVADTGGGKLGVTLLPGQESFRIGPMLEANAWAVIPEGAEPLRPGDPVAVASLDPAGSWQFPPRPA